MIFTIALVAWMFGTWASYLNSDRRLAFAEFFLGLICIAFYLSGIAVYPSVACLAVIAPVTWAINIARAKSHEQTRGMEAICCAALALVFLGFGIVTLATHHKPLLITLGFSNSDNGVWEAFQQVPLLFSPLVSMLLLVVATRLWGQARHHRSRSDV